MSEYFDVLKPDGDYADEVVSREECHERGLWHRAAVVFIVSTDNQRILLQQRAAGKKLWPNLWDVTSGGHVLASELGYQGVIRETKEELGIDITKDDLEYIGTTVSENQERDIINRHFNEIYIVHSDVDIANIALQEEEVQDIRWFERDELLRRIENGLEGLTGKDSAWHYLFKYFEFTEK